MAGDGIGEFDLQDVVVGIGFHLFHLSRLCRDIVVIFEDGIEELVIKLFGQCGGICLQGVEENLDIHFKIVVLETDRYVGKTETVEFVSSSYTQHLYDLAVCDEVHLLVVGCPEIVILGNHQPVAGRKFFFPVQDAIADTIII